MAPASVVDPLDRSLRDALQSSGTATTALVFSIPLALYGTTGALEAARRALNVVFELDRRGRSFLRRKTVDVLSTFVLMTLVLASLVMVFVGGGFARDLLGFAGLGAAAADIWNVARWPGAALVATLIFAFIYYVTPDVKQRAFHWLTPGAAVGVLLWLLASVAFSLYVSRIADVGAFYGAFTGAILLVGWLWLTNVALLFGAELNAEIERRAAVREGVPQARHAQPPGPGLGAALHRHRVGAAPRKRRIGSSESSIPSVTRVGSNTRMSPSRSRSGSGPVQHEPAHLDLLALLGPGDRRVVHRVAPRSAIIDQQPEGALAAREQTPPAGSRARAPSRPRGESVCSPASGSKR